jgi:hypothetical protein
VSKDLLALEARGHALAAEVEDEAEVDGDVEVDPQHVALDGGAEAHGGVQLNEPVQQRAARLVLGHAGLGLDQVQHVGAHAQLQHVRRAVPAVPPGRPVVTTATPAAADGSDAAALATAATNRETDPTAAADGSDAAAVATAATDRETDPTTAAASIAVAAVVPAATIASPAPGTRCAASVVAATGRTTAVATVVVARAAVRAGTGHRNEQEVDGKEEGRLGRHWSRLTSRHPATARQLQVCVSQWWRSSLHRWLAL